MILIFIYLMIKEAIYIYVYIYMNIYKDYMFICCLCFFCYEMLIMSFVCFFMGCFSFWFNEILFVCILHTHQSVVCVTNIFFKLVLSLNLCYGIFWCQTILVLMQQNLPVFPFIFCALLFWFKKVFTTPKSWKESYMLFNEKF